MAHQENSEIRLVKIELSQTNLESRLDKLEMRTAVIEGNHSEQVQIMARLNHTVENLVKSVTDLIQLTKALESGQLVFSTRFNIVIGILTIIGSATVAGVIKLLFFPGVAP